MGNIIKGKVSQELMEQAEQREELMWQEMEGGGVRSIRTTDNPMVKELRGGSVNGTYSVGTLKLDSESWSWYSCSYFNEGVGLPPMALIGWGEFLATYINAITEPKD